MRIRAWLAASGPIRHASTCVPVDLRFLSTAGGYALVSALAISLRTCSADANFATVWPSVLKAAKKGVAAKFSLGHKPRFFSDVLPPSPTGPAPLSPPRELPANYQPPENPLRRPRPSRPSRPSVIEELRLRSPQGSASSPDSFRGEIPLAKCPLALTVIKSLDSSLFAFGDIRR